MKFTENLLARLWNFKISEIDVEMGGLIRVPKLNEDGECTILIKIPGIAPDDAEEFIHELQEAARQ